MTDAEISRIARMRGETFDQYVAYRIDEEAKVEAAGLNGPRPA